MATVTALFDRYENANAALLALNELGYGAGDINVVAAEKAIQEKLTRRPEDKEESTAAGAVIGGLAGLVFGVTAVIIPGIGPVITAGTIATVLGSTAVGAGIGAATGNFRESLNDIGVPEAEAQLYAEGIRRGGILITVVAEGDPVSQVKQVFQENEAVDLETRRSMWEKGEVSNRPEQTESRHRTNENTP